MGNDNEKLQRILEGDQHRNFTPGTPGHSDVPERGMGKGKDAATLAHEKGWEMLTINLNGNLVPANINVTCQLFQTIYNYGIAYPAGGAGAVLFPGQNNAVGVVATAATSTYQALVNQFNNRSARCNLARLNFTDPNQQGLLFQWIEQDTLGYGMYFSWNLSGFIDPWQFQAKIIDVPVLPGKHGFEDRGLIREDSGFNVVVEPTYTLNIIFFLSQWNSTSTSMSSRNHHTQHTA